LPITARQYGEVVLPDAASGNSPGTLASLQKPLRLPQLAATTHTAGPLSASINRSDDNYY